MNTKELKPYSKPAIHCLSIYKDTPLMELSVETPNGNLTEDGEGDPSEGLGKWAIDYDE